MSTFEHETTKTQLKEDVERRSGAGTEQHPEEKPGLIEKLTNVGKMVYEELVGHHVARPEERAGEKMTVAEKLEERREETLREADLYRAILQENEEDLIRAAEKLERSQQLMRNELDQVRCIFKENEDVFRTSTEQLQKSQEKIQKETDLINGILSGNEEVLKTISEKLELSAKKLRAESNRIKAEELNRAADELKYKAEVLEKTAEVNKTQLQTLEHKQTEKTTTTTEGPQKTEVSGQMKEGQQFQKDQPGGIGQWKEGQQYQQGQQQIQPGMQGQQFKEGQIQQGQQIQPGLHGQEWKEGSKPVVKEGHGVGGSIEIGKGVGQSEGVAQQPKPLGQESTTTKLSSQKTKSEKEGSI